jgi:hypothetical protein
MVMMMMMMICCMSLASDSPEPYLFIGQKEALGGGSGTKGPPNGQNCAFIIHKSHRRAQRERDRERERSREDSALPRRWDVDGDGER